MCTQKCKHLPMVSPQPASSGHIEQGKGKNNNQLRNTKGFTLIELLITVAIIAILAMVALPQFAAYRVKSFNSNATSDLRNFRLVLEACYVDQRGYPGF